MFVIVSGDIVNGVNLIGTFQTRGDALEYATTWIDDDWVVTELESPNDATICELCHAPVWEQEWEES